MQKMTIKKKIIRKLHKHLCRIKIYFLYLKQKKEWRKQGGKIHRLQRILTDYEDSAGVAEGGYFHQDLLVATFIAEKKPKKHIDVGSRIDGFVAHVASYREIEVYDIRPLPKTPHKNIKFIQKDIMKPQSFPQTDSLSCLHTLEHFGLGRYGDSVHVDGHIQALKNLISLLETNGTLYLSFPICAYDEVHFNAQRVFHPLSIPNLPIAQCLKMERFDYVDRAGKLHLNMNINHVVDEIARSHKPRKPRVGIYTFRKQ